MYIKSIHKYNVTLLLIYSSNSSESYLNDIIHSRDLCVGPFLDELQCYWVFES